MVINIPQSMTNVIMPLGKISAWQQRMIIGATALATQPLIDYYSIKDPETKKYAAIRTTIKVAIQCATGVFGRLLGQKVGETLVKAGKIKIPAGIDAAIFPKAVGNICSIYCAFMSIPLIEMPYINKLLTVITDKFLKPKKADANQKKVNVNA